jgi:uncharacterized protein YkwD
VAATLWPAVGNASASMYELVRTPPQPCANRDLKPTATNGSDIARATVCLINVQRAHYHLRALRANPELARIARGQSSDMVRGDYFGDESITGLTPLQRILPVLAVAHAAGTKLSSAQNIAWGTGGDVTPAGIVYAWMHSAPHRHVILTGFYRYAGAGATPSLPTMLGRGKRGATYVLEVAAFAR